jgi:hypothetical protein
MMFGLKSKFTFGTIIILAVISAISVFYIWRFYNNRSLVLDFEAPVSALRGTPFDVKVNISNNTGAILENAVLTLTLPEGVAFFGSDVSKTIDNKSLGNVGAGSLVQESYKIIVFFQEGNNANLKATLSYSPASLSARFEKNSVISINVGSSGAEAELVLPDEITSGEEFEITVAYKNISDIDFSDLELKIEYPPNFSFLSSSLKPDANNNIWFLGDLRKGSEGKFVIKGSIIGSEGESVGFNSYLSLRAVGQTYLVNQKTIQTKIAYSPLSVAIQLNNDPEYTARTGDLLNYSISYINKTDSPLRNAVFRAQLIGELFDFTALQTQAAFRQADNTLIWNSANTPSLALIPPGSAGIIIFALKTKSDYSIRRFSDKNFTLVVNAEGESPTVPASVKASRIFSKAKLETKVLGKIMLDAKGYFRDAGSGFLNKGPLPPKVGQATNFTIHWILKSLASDFSNVEVRAVLGDNVKMVGESRSNTGSLPTYDPKNNEVVWLIDRIQANQGVISDPIEAVFQIEVIPSSAQAGAYMKLIGDSFARGRDEWSGIESANNDVAITTALPDDVTVGGQGGVVQP